MNTDLPIIKFNPKLPKLSKNEKEVLKLLVEAGELIAPLYQEQEEQAKLVTKEEIEKAAKNDPLMLSPYTAIRKIDGKLVAIPYHIIYADYLKPIAEKLNKAGKLTENKEFGNFLHIQAKALLDGTYEDAIIAGLHMKPYILDISIGPFHHFDNTQLFFSRAPYYAWVGVLDIPGTGRLNNYKSITMGVRRKAFLPKEQIESKGIKAKVLDLVLCSGFLSKTRFTGLNLPDKINIIEKYGTEVTLFNQLNELRIETQILPPFNKIFSEGFKQGFTKEDLSRGYQRTVALHELAHSYLYYKNSIKNLKELFPCIYELAATVLGLRMAGPLLLKDRITNKQLESMIVAFISRSYYLIEMSKTSDFMKNYTMGSKAFIGFMFDNGALKEHKGLVIINFTKVFVSLHELSYILESLLSQGTFKDAEVFIKKYK